MTSWLPPCPILDQAPLGALGKPAVILLVRSGVHGRSAGRHFGLQLTAGPHLLTQEWTLGSGSGLPSPPPIAFSCSLWPNDLWCVPPSNFSLQITFLFLICKWLTLTARCWSIGGWHPCSVRGQQASVPRFAVCCSHSTQLYLWKHKQPRRILKQCSDKILFTKSVEGFGLRVMVCQPRIYRAPQLQGSTSLHWPNRNKVSMLGFLSWGQTGSSGTT